jgi:hypothetical protein
LPISKLEQVTPFPSLIFHLSSTQPPQGYIIVK